MRIQHNIMAMNAYRNYNNNVGMLSKNLEKLSSGYRINRAGDDAAGLAISEKMRAQITGLDAAQKNVKDGISLVKTAEGAMQEIQDMMNRMVYLATQSANGTYDNEVDRANLQKEVNSLRSEIDRIADSANFNGIKLLDGSLATTQLSEVPVEFNTQTITEGLAINEGSNGGGAAGEFTMDITGMFGTGDTVAINFSDTSLGTAGVKTLNFNAAGSANTFKGETVEEQAQSIADALNADAAIAQKFTVSAEGSSVKLVSKAEGSGEVSVTGFKATDTTVVVPNGALTAGTAGGTARTLNAGFTQLFDGVAVTGGKDIHEGDVLTFTFEGNGGETLTAKVTVTNDMIGDNTAATTINVVNALKNTSFEEVDGTVFQESKFKVSDFFNVVANKEVANVGTDQAGSIHFDAVKDGAFEVISVQVNDGAVVDAAAAGTQGVAGTAHKYEIAAAAGNFSYGDKMELSGTLADGRTFNLTLTAGEDFEIGVDYETSATNLANALKSDKVTVTLNDGTEVKANEIFADTGKEINVTAAVGTGALTFTSTKTGVMGAGVAGGITNVSVTTAEEASVEETLTAGVDQSSATSSLTFSDGLEYGTTVQIDGKNYELVQDARDASNRNNVAVVVSDLTDTADVASKLAAAINGEYGPATATFNATADGSTVTLATIDVGSDVQAVGISTPYGEEVTTASFKFDTDVVEEGSVFEFNGNSYEFVKTGEKATKAGAIAIEVADFETDTAKILGDAFADVAKGGVVSVADDGTVTLKSLEAADGTISKPTISFGNSLTLQIGDTSDIWNQLSVSIDDMHVAALGIADISIETQPDAQAAVDLIKDAINKVSMTRGTLGATQNRLEHTANNLSVMEENITDAESTIRDTDVADEMMAYTKNNILIQSAQAMLAQANAVPQGVLQLLQ